MVQYTKFNVNMLIFHIHTIKEKHRMIISDDTEKVFEKVFIFVRKIKYQIEENFPQILKAIHEKSPAHKLSDCKLSPWSGSR